MSILLCMFYSRQQLGTPEHCTRAASWAQWFGSRDDRVLPDREAGVFRSQLERAREDRDAAERTKEEAGALLEHMIQDCRDITDAYHALQGVHVFATRARCTCHVQTCFAAVPCPPTQGT